MILKKISKIHKKLNIQSIDVKIVKIKKFTEFKNKFKTLIIWKLWLNDFTGISVFFTDEKPIFNLNGNFNILNLKIIFHRGKKKIIFRKMTSLVHNIRKKSILKGYHQNFSLIDHKII
jgi:hypothetical protein